MRRICATLVLIAGLLLSLSGIAAENKTAAQKTGDTPLAYVIKVDTIISPASQDLIHRHLKIAADKNADIVILEMHTPGGLVDSMQKIIQDILDSPVPVATYVSPAGSHAASAGTYILYGSHIAAMAPGTNIGAATPIQMGGSGDEQPNEDGQGPATDKNAAAPKNTLEQKMVNDAAAYIRGLAELRGRNAAWAEKAVREAASMTASEALAEKVIDVIADDIPTLLDKVDGKTVKMAHGQKAKLRTKGAVVEHAADDWRYELLSIITHPNVALILMSLGSYGLIYEFATPGAIFPGLIGAICMLLGLYAMNVLPVNYAGLALILLGIGCMTAEAFVTSFGILGIGGAAAFAFGATMLIDTDIPGFGIDWWVIAGITGFSLVILTLLLGLAVKAQKKPTVTGEEELLSATAEVVDWSRGEGNVRVTGEVWKAVASTDFIIQPGDKVRVIEINGLTLTVAPLQ